MDTFPAYFPLAGRKVAIVGVGEAAEAKGRLFQGSPALLVWIKGEAAWIPAAYDGVALAFIAGDTSFATAARDAAHKAGALVNVVDKPNLSDFQTPSIIDRGSVVGAIGTGGSAPSLASMLRNTIEAQWPEGLGRLADLLHGLQPEIRATLPNLDQRRAYLRDQMHGPAANAALAGDMDRAMSIAKAALAKPMRREGVIWLLRSPAEPDLLSLRAVRVLGRVDRIVAGNAAGDLLAFARRDAKRSKPEATPVEAMVAWARLGLDIIYVEDGQTDPLARELEKLFDVNVQRLG